MGEASRVAGSDIVVECSAPLDIKHAARDEMENTQDFLDCPISGTGAQAVNKDLVIWEAEIKKHSGIAQMCLLACWRAALSRSDAAA